MPNKIYINISDPRWKKYKIDFAKIVNTAISLAAPESVTDDKYGTGIIFGSARADMDREITINLTNDAEIRKLNKKYRGIDRATNVLSFETGDAELMGDIFIAFDTVMKEISDLNSTSGKQLLLHKQPNQKSEILNQKFVAHATHMVVHGVLHLLGFDHLNDTDAEKMESTETKILARLGMDDPYDENVGANNDSPENASQKLAIFRRKTSWTNHYSPLLVLLCGAIASFGFAPFYMWYLTLLGLGGAYWLIVEANHIRPRQVTQKQAVPVLEKSKGEYDSPLHAYLFGAAYAAASFWWVLNSIYVDPALEKQFAIWTIPGIIGIALVGGLVFGLPFWMTRYASHFTPHASRPIIFAASWTFVLWLREWAFTGFPWNPIANIAMPFPALANSMALWGALGLTFVIVGFVAGVVELIQGIRHKAKGISKWLAVLVFLGLGIFGIVYGGYNIRITNHESRITESSEKPTIRIVQPATSAEQKATQSREQMVARAEDNLRNLMELSKSRLEIGDVRLGGSDGMQDPKNLTNLQSPISNHDVGASAPTVIIWPETAHPFLVRNDATEFEPARELGVAMVAGATTYQSPVASRQYSVIDDAKPRFYNSMIVADADGTINRIYSKSHLVPFGEYRPFGDIIPTPGQLSRGGGATLISLSPVGESEIKEGIGHKAQGIGFNFVPAICYEIIFTDSLVPRHLASHESRITNHEQSPMAIVNITNDTWFGKTPGVYQHLDMGRRYAIESGLPVVRANYSGISAFIAADGRVVKSLPVGISGVLDGLIPPAHITPYRRLGRDWTMGMIILFAVAMVFILRKRE